MPGFNDSPITGSGLGESLLRESGVGELISTRPRARYASGARTIVRVNGKPLAFAFSVSWNINVAQTEIRTVDDFLPYEMAPKFVTVSGRLSGWHIPTEGSPTTLHIQQNVLSYLFHRYITIEVRDRTTNALLFFSEKAVITSRSENINTDNLAQMTLEFRAIGWKDEKEPRLPAGAKGVAPEDQSLGGFLGKTASTIGSAVKNAFTSSDDLPKKVF